MDVEIDVKKEVDIRRKVLQVYVQSRDNFHSKEEYDDYLEEIEDIVYALVEGSKEEQRAAEARLKNYKARNAALIEQHHLAQEHNRRSQTAAVEPTDMPAGALQTYIPSLPGPGTGHLPLPRLLKQMHLKDGNLPRIGKRLAADENEEAKQRRHIMETVSGWTDGFIKKRSFCEAFGTMLVF